MLLSSHHSHAADTKAPQSIRCEVSDEMLSTTSSYSQRPSRIGLKNFSRTSLSCFLHLKNIFFFFFKISLIFRNFSVLVAV